MARTVEDAVAVLEVIAGFDPADTITATSEGRIPDSYRASLDTTGLAGARIGVLRSLFEVADAGRDGSRAHPFRPGYNRGSAAEPGSALSRGGSTPKSSD